MIKFRLNVNRSLLNSNAFTLPTYITKDWDETKYGLFEIDGKTYQISVSGKHEYWIGANNRYEAFQANINTELAYELRKIFAHSFMVLESGNKLKKGDEYLDIELTLTGNDIVGEAEDNSNYDIKFKVVDKKVITNEYTNYFHKLAERNELALSTTYDKDMKHLINYSSDWMSIEELEEHKGAKNCIYMWVDFDKKYIYIGKTDDLLVRMKQHIKTPENKEECIKKYGDIFNITHFRYDTVSPHIANELIEALEMRSIRTVASLLPNRSKGKNRLKGVINSSGWKQINNKYKYH